MAVKRSPSDRYEDPAQRPLTGGRKAELTETMIDDTKRANDATDVAFGNMSREEFEQKWPEYRIIDGKVVINENPESEKTLEPPKERGVLRK